MRTYGQYCPIARGAEIFAERWTPLIIRNLHLGCAEFGEILEGAPGLSRTLLVQRLRQLERLGIVAATPKPGGRGHHYALTLAGDELFGVCRTLGEWGARWLEIAPENLDPFVALWSMCNALRRDRLPDRRVVIRFEFTSRGRVRPERYWLLIEQGDTEICKTSPGLDDDLCVTAEAEAFVKWHAGQLSWAQAIRENRIQLDGSWSLARAFPTWNARSMFAHVRPVSRTALTTTGMLCLLTAVSLAQQPTSLIRNGGFEEGPGARTFLNLAGGSTAMPGWVVTGEGIDLVGAGYWRSSEGTYAIDLDGSARSRATPPHVQGGIAQTFATVAGKRYRVTFDLAGNPNRGPVMKPMRVSAAGQSTEFVFDATGRTGRDMGWTPREWVFTAAADSTTLEFTSLTKSPETGYSAAVDRVAVVVVDDAPLKVSENERAIEVRLGAEILFDTGESMLRPQATEALGQLAALIREHPDLPIEIEGHTDSVGTRAYNARLSQQRAEAVKRWLAANGPVPEGRMTTRGLGPTQPVAPNATAEGRQQNRRVEVRLLK